MAIYLLCESRGTSAQELEPRAYSPSPIGTNFLVSTYTRWRGDVTTDSALPIPNVQAAIDVGTLSYSHSFGLFGQSASAAILLPYIHGELSGVAGEQATRITRSGLGDVRLRFVQNLIGSPALTPEAFAQRLPSTTAGASVTVIAPTGYYNPANLVNVSFNRWAFRPEIGVSQPLGPWFVEGAGGVWLYTRNNNFLNGHVRSRDPIWSAQLHAGYYFQPGLWLAATATYYAGGETFIDGIAKQDEQSALRYGLTLSVPLVAGLSTKLAWASWLTAHNGGRFDSLSLALQYRWFDP